MKGKSIYIFTLLLANYTMMMSLWCDDPTINPPVLDNTEGGGHFYDFHTTTLRNINDIVQS